MGKIITVGNLKGGTGKSTTAVNLACALARSDRSVLLIDADAQGTATDWLVERPPVAVVPLPLAGPREAEAWAARVLAFREPYDAVVIDLPPQMSSGITSALLLTDLFVVPVTPSGADVRATGKALELLRRVWAMRRGERPVCLLVPNRVDRRTALGRRATTLLDGFGVRIGPTIRQRTDHVEAFNSGKWIGAYAPTSMACSEIRALARVVENLAGFGPAVGPRHDDGPRPHGAHGATGANGAGRPLSAAMGGASSTLAHAEA